MADERTPRLFPYDGAQIPPSCAHTLATLLPISPFQDSLDPAADASNTAPIPSSRTQSDLVESVAHPSLGEEERRGKDVRPVQDGSNRERNHASSKLYTCLERSVERGLDVSRSFHFQLNAQRNANEEESAAKENADVAKLRAARTARGTFAIPLAPLSTPAAFASRGHPSAATAAAETEPTEHNDSRASHWRKITAPSLRGFPLLAWDGSAPPSLQVSELSTCSKMSAYAANRAEYGNYSKSMGSGGGSNNSSVDVSSSSLGTSARSVVRQRMNSAALSAIAEMLMR